MQENIKTMLQVFGNCNDFQKKVYVDTLNDLLSVKFEAKKNIDLKTMPEGVDIAKISRALNNFLVRLYPTSKELNKGIKDFTNEFKEDFKIKNKKHDSYTFSNLKKESVLFLKTDSGKSVRDIYGGFLGISELEEIHFFRKQFLDNLLDKGLIDIHDLENTEFNSYLNQVLDELSVFDKDGKLQLRSIEDVKDNNLKSLIRELIAIVGGDKKLEELVLYLTNNFYVESFSYKKEELELLYEKFTGERISKASSYIEYQGDNIALFYDSRSLPFMGGDMPYKILSYLYHSDFNGKITLPELYKKIYYRDYSCALNKEERTKITRGKDNINRRFKKEYGVNIIQFKNDVFTKLR